MFDFYLRRDLQTTTLSLISTRESLLEFAAAIQEALRDVSDERLEGEGYIEIPSPQATSWRSEPNEFYFQVYASGQSGAPARFQKVREGIPFWMLVAGAGLSLVGVVAILRFVLQLVG